MIMNTFDLSQVYFPRKFLVELRFFFFFLLLFNLHITLNNKGKCAKKRKKNHEVFFFSTFFHSYKESTMTVYLRIELMNPSNFELMQIYISHKNQ